jgi:sugar lactone lactonase YvrE
MRNNVKADRSPGEAGGQDGIPYRIDPDGRITIHRTNVGISNTLTWSPDGRRFYFGDSLASMIWAYDYDPQTGNVSNEIPFLENFSRELPDGSTVDSQGYLWNCRFYGACIVRPRQMPSRKVPGKRAWSGIGRAAHE